MKKSYHLNEPLWLYPGKAAWCFITLPEEIAEDIDYYFSMSKRGWGSLPVTVALNESVWNTSIFPDKKSKSYLLPVKAAIRKKEQITAGDTVPLTLCLES